MKRLLGDIIFKKSDILIYIKQIVGFKQIITKIRL